MANHGMHYMSHCLNSHNTLSITPIEAALYDPLYDPLYKEFRLWPTFSGCTVNSRPQEFLRMTRLLVCSSLPRMAMRQ